MIEYFFRSIPDGPFHVSPRLQMGLVLIMLLTVLTAFILRHSEKAFKVGIYLLTLQLFMLNSWYIITQYEYIQGGLPLYHCRIAMFGIVICYFLGKEKLMDYFGLLGFIGAATAFGIPAFDPFSFPHITNFSFVFGHLCLIYTSTIIITQRSELSVKNIVRYTIDMNLAILIADIILNANYGFLTELPAAVSFLPFQGIQIAIVITTTLTIVMTILHFLTLHLTDWYHEHFSK